MHFLLIPYTVLVATFVFEFRCRAHPAARAGAALFATLLMAMMFAVLALRPGAGDSGRYYSYFLEVRNREWSDVLGAGEFDVLYRLLNWTVGRVGVAAWLLYGSALSLYMGVFGCALKRCLGTTAAAALVVCYSGFPIFVSYGANGIRQGLALVFLLMAYVDLKRGAATSWLWLFLAPLWHSAAWLAVVVAVTHELMCRCVTRPKLRWVLVLAALCGAIALSATGLNERLLSALPKHLDLGAQREAYIAPTAEVLAVGYRTGFRSDFLLFSGLPVLSALFLRRRIAALAYAGSGWWLSLYLSLNVLYHLFSFAPYADRFAGFSWFIMPLVMFLQVRESARPEWLTRFVAASGIVNAVVLQLYTGQLIGRPVGW